MIDEYLVELAKEVGFPIAVALILLYDKIKSNGSLKEVVRNNNRILTKIEANMDCINGKNG